jgi:hypothetical protein
MFDLEEEGAEEESKSNAQAINKCFVGQGNNDNLVKETLMQRGF